MPKTDKQLNSMSAQERIYYWDRLSVIDNLKKFHKAFIGDYCVRDIVEALVDEEGLDNLPVYLSCSIYHHSGDSLSDISSQWQEAIRDILYQHKGKL